MNIEEYQQRAVATALPTALNYDYLIPGLVAEVGEVFGKVAKSVRDEWSRERLQDELKAELGDVCWFWVLICHVGDVEPQELHTKTLDLEEFKDSEARDLLRFALSILRYAEVKESSLWYMHIESYGRTISRVAMAYGLDMQEIMEYNIEKLESRKARGTLKGNGDTR